MQPPAGDSGTPDSGVRGDASVTPPPPPPVDAGDVHPDAQEPDTGPMDPPDSGEMPDSGPPPCTYPAGARRPMTLNEVIHPYSWPTAIDPSGATTSLSLETVHCANDAQFDWNRYGHLLFVSLPAW